MFKTLACIAVFIPRQFACVQILVVLHIAIAASTVLGLGFARSKDCLCCEVRVDRFDFTAFSLWTRLCMLANAVFNRCFSACTHHKCFICDNAWLSKQCDVSPAANSTVAKMDKFLGEAAEILDFFEQWASEAAAPDPRQPPDNPEEPDIGSAVPVSPVRKPAAPWRTVQPGLLTATSKSPPPPDPRLQHTAAASSPSSAAVAPRLQHNAAASSSSSAAVPHAEISSTGAAADMQPEGSDVSWEPADDAWNGWQAEAEWYAAADEEMDAAVENKIRWQDRGPPGGAGGIWKNQRWRHGSERWGNRGGKKRRDGFTNTTTH